MIRMPLVSVVVPSYNHEHYIQDCIKSIINQDYGEIELIIIDDGSTDNSVNKIKILVTRCKKRFVRFKFLSRKNKGLSETLNEALTWCKGSYFSAIASDDIMYFAKTSVLLQHLERDSQVAGVFCGSHLIDLKGKIVDTLTVKDKTCTFDDILLINHSIIAPSQLLRTKCLREVGGFKPNLYIEDWYMWLALTEKGYTLKVVNELLVGYRQHNNNISKNVLMMYESRKEILSYYKNKNNYKKSLSIVHLMASIDYTAISKVKSIEYLIKSILAKKDIVLSLSFYRCLLKILIPRFFISWIKSILNNIGMLLCKS